MAVLRFVVPTQYDGNRLDVFLRTAHGVSGTTLKHARRMAGGLTIDGAHIRTIDPVRAGSIIALDTGNAPRTYAPCDVPVPVLYEDDSLTVFDKPAGMPCHPSRGHPRDTLANVFAARPQTMGQVFRPLGRLDADTSGLVVAARHAHAAYALEGRIHKYYLALLNGCPTMRTGTVDAPIGRECVDAQRRIVCLEGQHAVTHYEILVSSERAALASLWLETGRTHQIRVHMAHLGHPLLGDSLYGGGRVCIERHALHCAALQFVQPMTGTCLQLFSPLPPSMLLVACGLLGVEAVQQALDSYATIISNYELKCFHEL